MFTFAADYYLFVFAASLGVVQIAVSLGRLNGLLVLKSPVAACVLGVVLVLAAFVWFFTSAPRNLNDYEGGLDGNIQALFFFLGALTAVLVTFAVSSLVNARMRGGDPEPGEGLDALKRTNYVRALGHSLHYWWREWRTQTKSYFSG